MLLSALVALSSTGCKRDRDPPTDMPGDEPVMPSASATEEPAPPDAPAARRVLLVVIDAVRADALGCYGYQRGTSPNIDALASESIVFESFYSSSPWTLPAFGTLLTGVSPPVHRTNLDLREFTARKEGRGTAQKKIKKKRTRIAVLNQSLVTLPEIIKEIPSFAIVNNSFLHPKHGFSRGFDSYDHENAGFAGYRRAEETTRATIEKLTEHEAGPFFGLVHYFDPHVPYNPPEPFSERLAMGKPGRVDNESYRQFKRIRNGRLRLKQAEKLYLRGLYDGEIAYVDHWVGELVSFMKKSGMIENTWLIVTADHGEEFWEHGGFEHGHRFEDEVTRVPLIIRPPGREPSTGVRVRQSAGYVDLASTIPALLGLPHDERFEGRSLIPPPADEAESRPVYMDYKLYGPREFSYFDGRYKIVLAERGLAGYMYDLMLDPMERKKLRTWHPEFRRLKALAVAQREMLEREAEKHALAAESIELAPDVQSALEALGYLSPD